MEDRLSALLAQRNRRRDLAHRQQVQGRKQDLRATTQVAAALSICLSLASCCTAPAPTAPPNILLIVGDDQGYADLSCAGLIRDVKTPNLDALARRGVRFTNSYSTSPICNASRAGLVTGCYQQRFGTFWYGGKGIHDARFTTLPELLAGQGYTTGYIGKVHYGSGKTARPNNRSFPLQHGFDSFYGCFGGRKHYLIHNKTAEQAFLADKRQFKRKGQSLQKGPMWVGAQQQDQEGLSTELFGQRARKFLQANSGDGKQPFFLQLAFTAVHNFTHQLPEEYLRKHNLEGYHDWDPTKEDYYDWYRNGRKPNNPEGRAHYLGQLQYLDREIGKVLACLDQLQMRDNTVVIYLADNGGSTPIYADNTPLRGSKYTLYEGGIRIPMIVSWPGQFEAGAVRSNVVSAFDLLPTICTATGTATPAHIDGKDLSPLLRGQNASVGHHTLVWDTGHETAVRHGTWKLKTASSRKHADHEMVELEIGTFLYDLSKDPSETTDLAAKHPDIVKQLQKIHQTWKAGLAF
jgi:arylsulfatase B